MFASDDQPRTSAGRFDRVPVQEADGGMEALDDPIDRYNAEGSIQFPPLPHSAVQVHRFWSEVYVSDQLVEKAKEKRRATYDTGFHRGIDRPKNRPQGSQWRTAYRVQQMLTDAEKLPEEEKAALRAMKVEVAPQQYMSLEELDEVWMLNATSWPNIENPGTEWFNVLKGEEQTAVFHEIANLFNARHDPLPDTDSRVRHEEWVRMRARDEIRARGY